MSIFIPNSHSQRYGYFQIEDRFVGQIDWDTSQILIEKEHEAAARKMMDNTWTFHLCDKYDPEHQDVANE